MGNPELAREIGGRMRKAREAVFGKRSGTSFARVMKSASQSDVSRWETGVRVPSVVDFVRFAQACGVAPEKILAGVAPAAAQQLELLSLRGVDAPAAKVVRRLVGILRERSAPSAMRHGRRRAS